MPSPDFPKQLMIQNYDMGWAFLRKCLNWIAVYQPFVNPVWLYSMPSSASYCCGWSYVISVHVRDV